MAITPLQNLETSVDHKLADAVKMVRSQAELIARQAAEVLAELDDTEGNRSGPWTTAGHNIASLAADLNAAIAQLRAARETKEHLAYIRDEAGT